MAETNKKEDRGVCDCATNGGMVMQRHMVHRMIFVIIVVFIAFWCGLKLGEIKGFMTAGYMGYAPMHGRVMMMHEGDDRDMMWKKETSVTAPAPAEAPVPESE